MILQVFGDFVLAKPAEALPKSSPAEGGGAAGRPSLLGKNKGIEILRPTSNSAHLRHAPRIRPVFFLPEYGEGSAYARRQNCPARAAAPSAPAQVQDALVDQFYLSQVYETVASDHDEIGATMIPLLPRCCFRWATLLWPTARFCYLVEGLSRSESSCRENLSLLVTYVADSLIVLGGDWEELGRSVLPTRLVARDLETGTEICEVHGFLTPDEMLRANPGRGRELTPGVGGEDLYCCKSFGLGDIPAAQLEKGFVLEFEVEDAAAITFCDVVMPVAEIAIVAGGVKKI